MATFWVLAPCGLVEVYGRFRAIIALMVWGRQQASLKRPLTSTRLHGTATRKAANLILAAVRTSDISRVERLEVVMAVKLSVFSSGSTAACSCGWITTFRVKYCLHLQAVLKIQIICLSETLVST
jgi:hypothetical protein